MGKLGQQIFIHSSNNYNRSFNLWEIIKMPRYKIKLRTIQKELEKAVSYLNQQTKTPVQSSGRTDAGVHALGQVAHFDLNIEIPEYKIKQGLNTLLPNDIHIIKVEEVTKKFHARFSAKKKEYIYKINLSEYNPIMRNYEYQYEKKLDIEKMEEAIHFFEGTHDFTSFISSEDLREDKIRTIYKTAITRKKDTLIISFQAYGFMKYQVRNMVGLLIEIGSEKKEVNDVEKILNLRNRKTSIKIAPAEGLYLRKVWYE